jgi:acyl-CoA thioesterase
MRSPSLADGRGLNHGVIHDEAGTLIASTAQQGTVQKRRPT